MTGPHLEGVPANELYALADPRSGSEQMEDPMSVNRLKTTVASLAVVSVLAGGGLAYAGDAVPKAADHAQTQAAAKPAAQTAGTEAETAADRKLVQTVDEAFSAMGEVRAARLALFDGAPEQASKYLTDAAGNLKKAEAQMPEKAIKGKKAATEGDAYVPFYSSLTLDETFRPDENQKASIAKAGDHLAKGDQKAAAEVLKAASVDVTVQTAMIPARETLDNVQKAASLIGEKKYYEANLALKAVEDSVQVDRYSADNLPAQG